jgi:hypothetical protein
MTTIAGTLQCAYYGMLWKCLEVWDGKREFFIDEASNGDFVCAGIDVRNGAVIAVVAVFGDETVPGISILID